MTGSTEREKHCSVADLGRIGAVHDGESVDHLEEGGGLTIASPRTTWTASCSSALAVCLPGSDRFARRRRCTAEQAKGRAQPEG